jgi:hypothetical protein
VPVRGDDVDPPSAGEDPEYPAGPPAPDFRSRVAEPAGLGEAHARDVDGVSSQFHQFWLAGLALVGAMALVGAAVRYRPRQDDSGRTSSSA